jgi:acyl-CoA thioester hydrolase
MFSSSVEIEIAFHDIDILQVAWHGHYFKYFELARTALMRSLDLDWPTLRELGFAMPVTKVECKFKKPLCYGRTYTVRAMIDEYDYPALAVRYQILPAGGAEILAEGHTRQVYVNIISGESCFVVPEPILARFQQQRRR